MRFRSILFIVAVLAVGQCTRAHMTDEPAPVYEVQQRDYMR